MCGCDTHTTATETADTAVQGATFSVEDMTCTHCAGTIDMALKAGLPGTPFSIDLDNQQVTVAGDAKAAEAIIRDAGYEPKLLAA